MDFSVSIDSDVHKLVDTLDFNWVAVKDDQIAIHDVSENGDRNQEGGRQRAL